MITKDDCVNIMEKAKKDGHVVRIRDIAFCVLMHNMGDEGMCYAAVFGVGDAAEALSYANSSAIKYLYSRIAEDYLEPRSSDNGGSLTFEQNRDAMIKMIDDLEEAYKNKKIAYKDYSDRVSKLRIALNDKFSINEKVVDNRVIVESKFNAICKCGREIYIPTKQELMKKYNLVEG